MVTEARVSPWPQTTVGMDINIIEILGTLGTILSGIGIGWMSKSGRVKEKADAYRKMGEAYQYRIDTLHEDVKICNGTIKELQERIADLNHALNAKEDEIQDKKGQIRKLTEQMWQAEQEANRINASLVEAQREIGDLRVALEYALEWRCEHPECEDPRGRRPPNGKLCGQTFCMPPVVETFRKKAMSIVNKE